MLKKVVIAGLAVVVGVAVLAWVSPPLFDWMVHQGKSLKDSAEEAVPLEQRIEILKDKLRDFDKEKTKYFDQVAHAEREVKELDKGVTEQTARLDARWTDIQARRDVLNSKDVRVSYNGQAAPRESFEKKLTADFEAYQIDEKTLESQKDLLEARTKSLEDGKAQLAVLESKKAELAAKLTRMEQDLKLVRQQQAQSNLSLNDSDLDKLNADADVLAGKITDQKRSLELQQEYGSHPSDAQPAKPAAGSDIQKQIDAYKAARNGEPAPNVAGQH